MGRVSIALLNHIAYVCLIFTFTYIYFILKDNGFSKSFQVWMYIQALLIGTTFINFSFQEKIFATTVGYLEGQLILHLAFFIFKNKNAHEKESSYKDIITIPIKNWFSLNNKTVLLALRGSISAAVLYAICILINDLKPNWAVVVLVSSLQRDDSVASMRVIKGTAIGSIIGWPISIAVLAILSNNPSICPIVLWLLVVLAFMFSLEQVKTPTLTRQVILTILFLVIVTCIVISINAASYTYVHSKIFNSLAGAFAAFCVLLSWDKCKSMVE